MFIPKSHIPTVTAVALTLGACGDDKSSSNNPSSDAGSNGSGGAGTGTGGSATGGAAGFSFSGAGGAGGTAATGGTVGSGGAGGVGGSSGAGGVDPSVLEAYCLKFQECARSDFAQYYSSVRECVDTYTQFADYLVGSNGDPCADAINASYNCQSMLSCDDFAQYYTLCNTEIIAADTECVRPRP